MGNSLHLFGIGYQNANVHCKFPDNARLALETSAQQTRPTASQSVAANSFRRIRRLPGKSPGNPGLSSIRVEKSRARDRLPGARLTFSADSLCWPMLRVGFAKPTRSGSASRVGAPSVVYAQRCGTYSPNCPIGTASGLTCPGVDRGAVQL